jgi:hypothetical protein
MLHLQTLLSLCFEQKGGCSCLNSVQWQVAGDNWVMARHFMPTTGNYCCSKYKHVVVG